MKTVNKQINEIIRSERLQVIRSCCFVLSAVALVYALVTLGFVGGIDNPKSAFNIFSVFALSGYLRPFALTIAIFGLVIFIVGIIITITIAMSKRKS
jgi:hypothetical protein